MPWNLTTFDSTGKISDARTFRPILPASGGVTLGTAIASGLAYIPQTLTASGSALLDAVTSAGTVGESATLIYSQDFEAGTSGLSSLTGNLRYAAANPHSGTYVLRGNLNPDRYDPLLEMTPPSGNLHPEIDNIAGSVSARNAMTGCYMRWWCKLDDCTWGPSTQPKLGYFWSDLDYTNAANSIWPVMGVQGQEWKMGRNSGGTQPISALLSANWPGTDMYFPNPDTSFATNGTWNLVEMWWDYTGTNSRGYNYFNIWVNGNKLVDDNTVFTDGDFDLPSEFKLRGMQFWHLSTDTGQLASSSDGTGYHAGYELDDIEIWDGRPAAYSSGRW